MVYVSKACNPNRITMMVSIALMVLCKQNDDATLELRRERRNPQCQVALYGFQDCRINYKGVRTSE